MSRRKARVAAVQYIYANEFGTKDEPNSFLDFVGKPTKEEERDFTKKLIDGTVKNLPYIDSLIKQHAKEGDDIMSLVDKCILRVGIYELLFVKDTPPIVVINEYVNIAKELSKESSKALVNAILDKIHKGESDE